MLLIGRIAMIVWVIYKVYCMDKKDIERKQYIEEYKGREVC